MSAFGSYLRELREAKGYTQLRLAAAVGCNATGLSRAENEESYIPSEEIIVKIAVELGEDPDILLAIAGRVSEPLQTIIRKRPKLFAEVIRSLDAMPENAILRVVREVKDGKW